MRENRPYGSEGGESSLTGLPYPYFDTAAFTASNRLAKFQYSDGFVPAVNKDKSFRLEIEILCINALFDINAKLGHFVVFRGQDLFHYFLFWTVRRVVKLFLADHLGNSNLHFAFTYCGFGREFACFDLGAGCRTFTTYRNKRYGSLFRRLAVDAYRSRNFCHVGFRTATDEARNHRDATQEAKNCVTTQKNFSQNIVVVN